MVISLERGADLHKAQLMPLPLTVQTGFTFLVLAHPGSPGQRAVNRMCVCVCVCVQWLKWLDYWQIAFLHLQVRKNAQEW